MISHNVNAMLGYRAAESSSQRLNPGTLIKSSDQLLTDTKRRRLIEGARELWRNYSVAAWAIRKHLDYVSTFTFQANTGDAQLDQELENIMSWWSRPQNCDVANRHNLRRFIRLAEMRRVVDGDVFIIKYRDGKIQAIEGDRVRDPDKRDNNVQPDFDSIVHGVEIGTGGQARSIYVHKRDRHFRYEFERQVPMRNVLQLAYWDSFDQIRGVSPLASAINSFADVLEVTDYARLKAKVTQLFALAITRQMEDYDDEDGDYSAYDVDFGKGPIKLDLDPGDEASFLESKHPSTEFQSFITMSLQAALKALDIPWSFYDEAYTNFFGSRAALIQYQQSCRHKRDDLKELLDRLTGWRLNLMIGAGTLSLPRGMSVGDLRWDWIPAGVPWWDPAKEVRGDIEAINAGLRTRSEIRRERYGDDWRDVIRRLSEEDRFMAENGVSTTNTSLPPLMEDNEE